MAALCAPVVGRFPGSRNPGLEEEGWYISTGGGKHDLSSVVIKNQGDEELITIACTVFLIELLERDHHNYVVPIASITVIHLILLNKTLEGKEKLLQLSCKCSYMCILCTKLVIQN